MENQPSKLIPALIGGGTMAILSTVPLINLGNCLCCMWLLIGGAMAVWFYRKNLPAGTVMTGGDGALIGLLAGVFGALFFTLLNTLFMAMGNAMPLDDIFDNIRQYQGDIDPEIEDFFNGIGEEGFLSPFFVVIQLIASLIIYSIFGLLGGIIGVAIFKKKASPQQIEDQNNSL
ncbi:hypothetical protein KAR48_13655 [bacterium]|nr:hypothetical protein [bacterium]